MSHLWYVKSNSSERGPFTFEELLEEVRACRVATTSRVRQGAPGTWRLAGSIRGLFDRESGARPNTENSPSSPTDGWHCVIVGVELGPITFETVCRLISTRQLSSEDLLRSEGMAAWRRVSECGEFQDCALVSQSTGPRQPAPVPSKKGSADSWFYKGRLDPCVHGPARWAGLVDLLTHAGDAADDVVVRRGGDDSWVAFSALAVSSGLRTSQPAIVGQPGGAPANGQRVGAPQRAVAAVDQRLLRNIVRQNAAVILMLCLMLVAHVGLWRSWGRPFAKERALLSDLQSIVDGVHELRTRSTTDAEWVAFRERSRSALELVVEQLKQSVTSADPIRQQLLWVARDDIPVVAGPRRRDTEVRDKLLRKRLESIKRAIDGKSPGALPW
jgi:hypothetical protein